MHFAMFPVKPGPEQQSVNLKKMRGHLLVLAEKIVKPTLWLLQLWYLASRRDFVFPYLDIASRAEMLHIKILVPKNFFIKSICVKLHALVLHTVKTVHATGLNCITKFRRKILAW